MNPTLPTSGSEPRRAANEREAAPSSALRSPSSALRSPSSALRPPSSGFEGVRTVTLLLDEDLVAVIADYAVVHRMSVGELVREIVLEKFCPQRSELGRAA